MASNKEQHFVPVVYLKSWCINGQLNSLSIRDSVVRKQPPKSVAKKNHLYTLPSHETTEDISSNEYSDEMLGERFLMGGIESQWPSVINALVISSEEITSPFIAARLAHFAIIQSIRTPKILQQMKKVVEEQGKEWPLEYDSFFFAFSAIETFTNLSRNYICEVFKTTNELLITCDNPATFWLQTTPDETVYVPQIPPLPDLGKYPFKILMPIHPNYFLVLHLFGGIDVDEGIKNKIVIKPMSDRTVTNLNRRVLEGVDKVIFAKHEQGFNFSY